MEFIKRVQYEIKDREEADKIIAILERIGFTFDKIDSVLCGKNLYLRSIWNKNRKAFGINNHSHSNCAINKETFNQWYKEATGEELEEDEDKTTIKATEYPYHSTGWWLSCIEDDEIRGNVWYNVNYCPLSTIDLNEIVPTFYIALSKAFKWDKSPQGFSYWEKIRNGRTKITLLPDPSNNSIINKQKPSKNGNDNKVTGKTIVFRPSSAITGGKRYTGTPIYCRAKKLQLSSDILATNQSLVAKKAERVSMLSSKDLDFSKLVAIDQSIEELEKGLEKLTEYQSVLF